MANGRPRHLPDEFAVRRRFVAQPMAKAFLFRKIFTLLLLVGLLSLVMAVSWAEAQKQVTKPVQKKWKILHIMSYHSPWRWTDGQFNGFKAALHGLNIDYKVFQLDMKRRTDEKWKEKVSREARELIKSWKPDLVYTSDDYAQEYVAKYFINKKIPFVFSGVNADPSVYGFRGSKNFTGVLEEEHIAATLKLLKRIDPQAKKIAVIYDEGPTWPPVLARMKKCLTQFPDLKVVSWNLIHTFKQFKQRLKELQTQVDAIGFLGIFGFKGANGKNVSYKTVCRWVMDHSHLPDFSFWEDRISYGTLCTVNVSPDAQGYAAGKIARAILLQGRSPASFPMKPTVKGIPMINLLRAKKLGLKIKSGILLSVSVRKDVNKDF
jgi:ABC-type uncharacterized transport system substrate-binding protein